MRILAWYIVVGLSLGCESSPSAVDSSADVDGALVADGRPFDAGGAECNPVVSMGCNPGDKCTFLHPTEPDGQFVLSCAPDGDLAVGVECTIEPGEPDDCVGGSLCVWGRCQPLCGAIPQFVCQEGACGQVIGSYDPISVCYPSCDPLEPQCAEDYACYFHTAARETTQPACFPVGFGELGNSCTWSEECGAGLVCAGVASAPFETESESGECSPVCDPDADDCTGDTTCAEFEAAGFGACVPAG